MKDQTLQQIEVRVLLRAPVLPQLLRVAVHGAQRICREAPMAGSKAQEVAASVTSESLVFKTACLHIEAVHRRQERASKLKLLSWRQTIGVEMGSLYPHGMEAFKNPVQHRLPDPARDIPPSVVPPLVLAQLSRQPAS